MGLGLRSSLLQSADNIVGLSTIDSVIDFCESYRGLGIKLYPAQKVILKMTWGEALSDDLSENSLEVRDDFNEEVLKVLTEVQWLDYLYKNKFCNFSYEDYEEHRALGRRFGEIDLPMGRRATKTVITTANAGYLLYKIYKLREEDNYDFFEYFELIKSIPLYITFVSNNKTNSSKPYEMLRTFLKGSDFLSKYIHQDGDNKMTLLSPIGLDLEAEGTHIEGEYELIITHGVPSAQLRGDTNIFIALDEYCFLRDASARGKAKYLDEELYSALVPSTSTIIGKDGKSWGMASVLSSVNGKLNHMYQLYVNSFGDKNTLMFHLRSMDVNYKLDTDTLKSNYRKSKVSYQVEYLSIFDVTVDSWLEECWDDFEACINVNPNFKPKSYGVNGITYGAGIDQGFIFDPTVVAIGHKEPYNTDDFIPKNPHMIDDANPPQDVVVVDCIIKMIPEEGKTLDPFIVVRDIHELTKMFNIRLGVYDQYSRATWEAMLDKYGLIRSGRLEVLTATQVSNDMLANLTKEAILSHRLQLPNDEDMIKEFSGLQETYKGGLVKVENFDPDIHDDIYDAVSRLIFVLDVGIQKDAPTVYNRSSSMKESNSGKSSNISDKARGTNIGHFKSRRLSRANTGRR